MTTPYYRDDFVTIYHGDSSVIASGLSYGAVVSDPPYGDNWNPDTTRFSGGNNAAQRSAGRNDRKRVHGDDAEFDPTPWLACDHVILWGQNRFAPRLPVGSALVWIKRNDDAFGSFLSDAEIAWKKGGRGVYCFRDLSLNAITQTRSHPTQKPLALMQWCLSFVPAECVILDPFMGSGTTLRAAKDLGRRAIGIEMDERYCEIAAERCRQEALNLGAA